VGSAFIQENLVSSRPEDDALLLDTAFINAWGVAIRPAGFGGHWWIANTDTSRVTLYVGDSPTVPFGQDGLSVLGVPGAPGPDTSIVIDPPTRDGVPLPPANPTPATVMPPSNPTGQVYSGSTTDFLVDGTSLTGGALNDAPARFITVSEDGTIAAWGEFGSNPSQRMNRFEVVVDNSAPDANGVVAIYKGVTVSAETGSGNLLYAANFSQDRVDVFDAAWQPVAMAFEPVAPGGRDMADFAPFNVERTHDATLGRDVLIVAYAKVADAAGGEEESTDGFIAKFEIDGTFLGASDAGGNFNAPWGVALAPAAFGDYDNALLVGNFGDGRILALDMDTLGFLGFLLDEDGNPIVVDGLWDLIFGNGASLGATDKLYFAAGPEEESHGLFGSLAALPDTEQLINGTAADDTLQGGTATDTLRGGTGDDALRGSRGDDRLNGGDGQDTLAGGAGADRLLGQDGADSIGGGDGADLLIGGAGADTLRGDAGNDRFRYDSVDTGDLVADFSRAGGNRDRILLSSIDADTGSAGDQAFAFIGEAAFGNTAGELRAEAIAGGWLVEGDVDGDGAADLAIMLMTGATSPGADWFQL
jgi:uncharacterized protein (TIGR03118 family)